MAHVLPPTASLFDWLDALELGEPQTARALALWPLRARQGVAPPPCPAHLPLAEALARGLVQVDEVSEGGSVPHVRVRNAGDTAVLFLFGEEIRGAKQNRVANASFLVAPHSSVVLDVSCVEAGRWHRPRGAGFEAAEAILSSSLRRKMAQKVAAARARGKHFDADQAEVWSGIDERIRLARASSPTSAYADYRGSRAGDVEALRAAFRPLAGQLGFVAAIDGEIAGLEVLGRPEVLAATLPALVRGYAIDAVDAEFVRARGEGGVFLEPAPFLAAVARASVRGGPSLGLGEDLRLDGAGVVGCALACGGLVHLSAFPEGSTLVEPGPTEPTL